MCLRDVHRLNTFSSIETIEDGILISNNDDQSLKALLFPIDVTLDGISICFKDEHPSKAMFIEGGSFTLINELHPIKTNEFY